MFDRIPKTVRFGTRTLGALIAVVVVAAAASPAKGELITTIPSWDGGLGVGQFGQGANAETYGQTITVGATDTYLTDFSFRMRTSVGQTSRFEAMVMGWDPGTNRAVGPVLFNSGPMTNTGPVSPAFNAISVTTNVQLIANREFVLFFTASNLIDSQPDTAFFGVIGPGTGIDAYSGGRFMTNNNGSNFAALSSTNWSPFGTADLAFTANLEVGSDSPIPAPVGGVLFGFGFAGLGAYRALRRQTTVVA